MNYDEKLSALDRAVTYRVVLRLDYCTLTCGQSPCAAAGPPWCYYTYPTCRDPAHYSRGTKDYGFTLSQSRGLDSDLPYLKDLKLVPTEIRPQDNVTRRARLTLDFIDDAPLKLANPDKAVSNAETDGTYLRNLFARNPNLRGRLGEVWQGFEGLPVEDYRLKFRGTVDSIEWGDGQARVVLKDLLKQLDVKVPPRQSSTNALTAAYNGGTTMAVTSGAEFEAPGTVKLGAEYVDFTGRSGDTLTGCAAGRYGTPAVSHAAGTRVKQVVCLADPDDGSGRPADELFLTLLCDHGGLDALAMAVIDRGVTLSSAISDTALTLPVDRGEELPETGVVRLDDELIRYRGGSGSGLTVAERGAYGTEAASHGADTAVRPTALTDEIGRWSSGSLLRRFVEQSAAVKDLVNDLREQCLVHLWQNEDSAIAAKAVAPPVYSDEPMSLDDETGFIHGSTSWDPGHDLQCTRITVFYDPVRSDPGSDPDAYNGVLVVVDADAESVDYFDLVRGREVFADYIYREHEAMLLATRYLIRYRAGAGTFRFALELKDDALRVGDFVRITSSDVCDAAGATRAQALFEVIRKSRASDHRIEFIAIDTRLDHRYPAIAPASLTADYEGASAPERDRYGFVGDSSNRVGSAAEDGYYIY